MVLLQLACAAVVAFYVVRSWRAASRPGMRLARLALLAVAAWVAEQSAIAAYGSYAYAPSWSLFLGDVPLLVPCIWAVVIDLARRTAATLGRQSVARLVAVAGVLVLADALFIEPVCVTAGLWSWQRADLFGVPWIGLAGWSFFGAGAVWAGAGMPSIGRFALRLLAAVAALHALLFASWWVALKWTPALPEAAAATLAVFIAAAVSIRIVRSRRSVVWRTIAWARAPGAALLLALLARAHASAALWVYALALALPWLSVLLSSEWRRIQTRRPPASTG